MRGNFRARVDATAPEAWAVCDRCNFLYNHKDLHWQFEYRGLQLQNIRLLVCDRCLDVPFPFNQPIIVPPDPEPVLDARPAFWSQQVAQGSTQNVDLLLSTEDDDPLLTEDDKYISGS